MNDISLRSSSVISKWKEGKAATCFRVNFKDSQSCELAALSGVDCIWVDTEHCATSWDTVQSHILTAKAYNVDTIVRVSIGGSYSEFIKPLELDATGIMVPHVDNAIEAKSIVQTVKFAPLGMRPLDGTNADAKFRMLTTKEYTEQANSQRFTIAMIESIAGMEALEDICSTEGIDALLFGAVDYSQCIGRTGDILSSEIKAAKEKVLKTARDYGKHIVGGAEITDYRQMIDMGYDFIVVGTDISAAMNYCKSIRSVLL